MAAVCPLGSSDLCSTKHTLPQTRWCSSSSVCLHYRSLRKVSFGSYVNLFSWRPCQATLRYPAVGNGEFPQVHVVCGMSTADIQTHVVVQVQSHMYKMMETVKSQTESRNKMVELQQQQGDGAVYSKRADLITAILSNPNSTLTPEEAMAQGKFPVPSPQPRRATADQHVHVSPPSMRAGTNTDVCKTQSAPEIIESEAESPAKPQGTAALQPIKPSALPNKAATSGSQDPTPGSQPVLLGNTSVSTCYTGKRLTAEAELS